MYAGRELGAYGYVEKPWYLPGTRLEAFLAELERRGLTRAVRFAEAGPASDADLQLFHDADYLAWVRQRCASGHGSLDRAPQRIVARTRRLLEGIDSGAIEEALASLGSTLDDWVPFLESEELATHDAGTLFLTDTGRTFLADPSATLGGPTYARPHVEEAARWICGAALDATRRILAGELTTAFIPIAGFHHARAGEARMYCLYNDPALAIAAALQAIDGPVAYIDIDIHHGDGVYDAFAADPRVVIADLHAAGEAPGVVRREEGTNLTLSLGPGTDDAGYLAAFAEAEAFVRAARPAFVVFEAGVDGLATDPMSNQAITVEAIREVTRRVAALAREHAGGRLLVLGGGGYELEGTARAWTAVVETLLDA